MIADPRIANAGDPSPDADELHRLAQASLAADSGQRSSAHDAAIARRVAQAIAQREGAWLAALLDTAPTLALRRHLWRIVAERGAAPPDDATAGVRLFAMPLVIVTGVVAGATGTSVPAVLRDGARLAAVLREHGALGGNLAFALSNTLCAADAIDVARMPALVHAARQGDSQPTPAIDVPPCRLEPRAGEAAHLRFIVGSALAAADAPLFAARDTGRWGRPFADALMHDLATPGVSVLVLPRPPLPLLAAVAQGRAAQREVGAQLFASRAVRDLRAAVGEPVAIISAHRAADAPGGGELRLSLSSPLSPRDAQGFRCPLHDVDRVEDVTAMLVDLMRDCRVADVRVVDGVHADRDPLTGGPLLFKPDTLPAWQRIALH